MARLIFLLLFIGVIIYPIFLVNSIKKVSYSHNISNINDLIIVNGNYFIYDTNLSIYGHFKQLIHNKFYKAYQLFLFNVKKQEIIKANKIVYNKNIFFTNLFYSNKDYNFTSNKAFYNLNTKVFKGKKFFLSSYEYNASGDRFLLDKDKNIKATYTIFNLKVNE